MSSSKLATAIPVARRVNAFSYAIRNIVAEAQRVEAGGMRVRYLNVGDPNAFGFKTPPHLVAAVERAMRDGHNGYGPSAGIPAAREAVAAELTARGFPIPADRTLIQPGHPRPSISSSVPSSTAAGKYWSRGRRIRCTRRCSRKSMRMLVII